MKHNLDTVAEFLRENVTWHTVMNQIATIDTIFNDHAARFTKGDLIEKIVCRCSKNNSVEHVGCTDFDTRIPSLRANIEQKHTARAICTEKKQKLSKTITVKLLNSQGSTNEDNYLDKVIEKNFDYLLITSDLGAILYDKRYVLENWSLSASLKREDKGGDGIVFTGEPEYGRILYGPCRGTPSLDRDVVKKKKDELDRMFVDFLVEAEKALDFRPSTLL